MELSEILGWIQMTLFSLVTTPQIIKTIKTKNIEGVSILAYFIIVIANIIALWYALLINQNPLKVKYILGLSTALAYIFTYFKYRKNK